MKKTEKKIAKKTTKKKRISKHKRGRLLAGSIIHAVFLTNKGAEASFSKFIEADTFRMGDVLDLVMDVKQNYELAHSCSCSISHLSIID